MKKILLLIVFVIMVFPVSSVLAADVPVKIPYTSSNIPTAWMDDDVSTTSNFVPNTPYKLEFSTVANVYTINFVRDPKYPLTFSFFNEYGARIGNDVAVYSDTAMPYTIPKPVQGVKSITFTASYAFSVSSLSFTGTGGQPLTQNPEPEKFVIDNLTKSVDSASSITLSWNPIQSQYLKHYKVYQDDLLLGTVTTNALSISGLEQGESYTFKVVPVDTFDKEYAAKTITHTVPLPDTTPPAVPTSVSVVPDRYTALVKWNRPSDPDLAGYYVYLDGNRVNSSPITTESFNLTALNLETTYKVAVSAIDVSGNASAKSVETTFTTLSLETAPAAPSNLTASPYNGSVTLSWLPSSLAKNYKVYVDGEYKLTTDATSVKISVPNDVEYSFSVVASNDIGDSPMSTIVKATPSKEFVPDVSLGYKLSDVGSGVSSWFASYWLLLAFSIAIPLSFYVANRVKGLFA